VTAKSEADGDSAAVDLPDIDQPAFSAHRGDDRPRPTPCSLSYRSSSCPTFRAPGRRPTAESLYRSDATFFERLDDEAMIDLAPEEVAGAIRARP
jgi:hypothetical protein